jgi:branched-chain amino acid transport system substrate-binding protein
MKSRKALTKVHAAIVIVLVVAAVVVGAFTWQTLNPPPPPPAQPILIGASIPITGAFAAVGGPNMQWAYQTAVDQVNANGGILINGTTRLMVKLIIYDDKSDPTTDVSNIDQLVTVDKVNFLLGPVGTPVVAAAAGEAEKLHVLMVTGGASLLALKLRGWNYVFIPFESTDQEVGVFLEMLSKLPAGTRPTTIAEWSENTALGKEFGNEVVTLAPQYGFNVTLNEVYPPGATDYTDLIVKTKAVNPDIVMGEPTPPDAITLIRQSAQLGFSPKLFYLHRGSIGGPFYQALGKYAEDATFAFMWGVNFPTPGNKELVAAFNASGHDPARAGAMGAWYAVAQVLLQAITDAGSLNTANVIQAIKSSSFQTVAGTIKFDSRGISQVTLAIFQWQQGKPRIVYPPDLADSTLIYPAPPLSQR